ncbi:DHA2 family efflux MFS transporter permease subunit [Phytohabitans rumicis]|uniref:MFS transporter n=1 Tax=Phytohabitans rumicis TaxID=1076125 RepID=A0A6V8L5X2_9ACTN|nr:DHA2 family efflux MFS transporter permease subunit [Phytohabitans rumicis]GFJ91634.1 MFS transporter [Phytohabitans rumicis]
MESTNTRGVGWTWLAVLVAVFMVAIDTLVVTTALPVIRVDLGADLEGLEWTVNAYTLTFAVFLLSGAALGDRLGRRAVFGGALVVFIAASALAALSDSVGMLVTARAIQGLGAAAILPLTLTLLASVVSPEQRGHAFGLWGAMVGLGIALGPVIGGSITEYQSWQWIFWINVPIGLLLLPVLARVRESRGGAGRLDPVGTVLVTAGLFGIVYGLVRGNGEGWTSGSVLTGLIGGGVLVLAFLAWESRAKAPMVPLSLFRTRGFSLTMVAALIMPFGVFGAIFLATQYLQTVLGYTPLEAGVRTLPWTAMPLLAAPISGRLTDKIGGRPLVFLGLIMQAVGIGWVGLIAEPDLAYGRLVIPFILTGLGLGTFLAPVAQLAIGFAPPELEGVASGVSNAIRQFGTVLGVSVAGAILGAYGGFTSGQTFTDGLVVAYLVAASALAVGALVTLGIPGRAEPRPVPVARSGAGQTVSAARR